MSRKIYYTILCVCMLAIPVYGQQDGDVFDENTKIVLDKAITLNDAKNYLEAYRQIVLAEKSVDASLRDNSIAASALGDWEFVKMYWPIKKSKAEIAYMLGIYTDMETVSQELWQSVDKKKWSEGTSEYVINGLNADIAKIDGSRYYLTQKYDSAEIALNRALQLGSFPRSDDFVNKVHDDLAQLYYKQEKYDKALTHIDTILASPHYQNDSRNKEREVNIKTVQSQRAICMARLGRFAEALKEIEPIVRYFKTAGNKRLYAEALRKKAKILMLQYDTTGKYSPEVITCYKQYLAISKDYIDNHFVNMSESEREQYWMAEQPFVTDCYRLEDKAPELLYDVALYSKAVLLQMGRDFKEGMTVEDKKRALSSIRVNWQQVRDKMPASGSAIEFVIYEKQGKSHIGALVLSKNTARPKFVDLGGVTSISDYPLIDRLRVKDVLADTKERNKINILYNDSTLKGLIWNDKIVSAIGDSKDVYFSPDGILHQMGIEYMTPQPLEGKRFYRLTSTRLLTQGKHKMQTDKMLVCGGVEYEYAAQDDEGGNDVLAYSLLASKEVSFGPLSGSQKEIDSIIGLRKFYVEDRILRADSVTESALLQLMEKYHIVHISTHGEFYDAGIIGTDLRPASIDYQLSTSSIILAGANKSLRQNDFNPVQHDGILSAREIAKRDLKNVDLAVLSACMSGLGYITPDGVYGLQRGLKTAGVKTIISTLWSVDDEASSFFIIQLYKNLEAGMNLHTAFWTARKSLMDFEKTYGGELSVDQKVNGSFTDRLKSKRFENKRFNLPYFYNAFILIDGLE